MKLTNEQIQAILDGAPEGWTHYCTRNRQYFKRDGNTDRLVVWLCGTKSWSVPLLSKTRWLERRERLEEILELRQEVERLKEACGSTKLQLKNTIKLLRANNRKLERGKETNQEYFESMLTKFITDTTETGQFGWSDCQWLDDWKYEWLESLSENELREQNND